MQQRDGRPVDQAIELVHRADRARVLAGLIGLLRDFDLAEEALQDAFVAAFEAWPKTGIPANPAAWLTTTARRKAIDRIRRAAARDRRQREWGELSVAWTSGSPADAIVDDRLRLIFTCCHPALSIEAQIALTLRTLGGLSTAEVARAFVIAEPTLAQRLVRAKRKIKDSAIPYRVPDAAELPERLDAVLAVITLIFNAGYLPGAGSAVVRADLCEEAKRLAVLLADLLPHEPEPIALVALLQLLDSRRAARADENGRPLTLEEQDRELWDRAQILTALQLLERIATLGPPGPYALKAGIAAVHASTRHPADTDWPRIVDLYDRLLLVEPTPVVALNRCVAVAMTGSPDDGLRLLDEPDLAVALGQYHHYHLTRADLLRRAGRTSEAAVAYEAARTRTDNRAEHEFVDRRLEELALRSDGPIGHPTRGAAAANRQG